MLFVVILYLFVTVLSIFGIVLPLFVVVLCIPVCEKAIKLHSMCYYSVLIQFGEHCRKPKHCV